MANLWEETIETLKEYSLTWDDVDAIILEGDNVLITKENFEEVARRTNYDKGYGAVEIRSDLKIVGWNWWLERADYGGMEWWKLRIKPFIPYETKEITSLIEGE